MMTQAERIRQFIVQALPNHPEDIVAHTAQRFSVTRTTVHRHLTQLLDQGEIIKSGITRNIWYRLKSALDRQVHYKIEDNTSEHTHFQRDFADLFLQFPESIYDICHYGFTAILNNALLHSLGSHIVVKTMMQADDLIIQIQDNGLGLFQKIAQYGEFEQLREAVLHLSKGKWSSSPQDHQGEGIFFSARAFDRFEIYANGLHYLRDNHLNDWSLESVSEKMEGTQIKMRISRYSPRTIMEVLKQYQFNGDAAFSRTEVLVNMSQWGNEPLISREQAKRVTLGLEKFRYIVLDFKEVRLLGQGFVDELFKVFTKQNPEIVLDYINANPDVTFMIKRGGGY